MENQCQHLTEAQHIELKTLLQKFEELFNGTLGTRKTDPVYSKLKDNADPIRSQPYPLPNVHEEMFKKEVERLVQFGVLELEKYLEWGAPSLAKPKPKSNIVSHSDTGLTVIYRLY